MNDDKSDAHSNLKFNSKEDAKEFVDGVAKSYCQDVPKKQRRSTTEFTKLVINGAYKWELLVIGGNTNTAEPNSVVSPEGTITVYISDENSRCGRKQLLYWCIMMLTDKQFFISNTKEKIFDISADGQIIAKGSPPHNREMDKNSFAMNYTKEILKKFF